VKAFELVAQGLPKTLLLAAKVGGSIPAHVGGQRRQGMQWHSRK
jgi:hypothetical protein